MRHAFAPSRPRTNRSTPNRALAHKLLARLALLGATTLASCSGFARGGEQSALPAVAAPALGNPVSGYIKHVVVIVQENRSFENLFAGYPGADAPLSGYKLTKSGKRYRVPLQAITWNGPDFSHNWYSSMVDWDNGKMDGFDILGPKSPTNLENPAYAYVERSLIAPYWTMARRYVLADRMFPTEFGGSFTAHLTLVAGTDNLSPSKAEVNFADGNYDDCDSPSGTRTRTVNEQRVVSGFTGPFPCFTQFKTIADTLDAAGVRWKYYATTRLDAGAWEPFEAIKYVRYGPDWSSDVVAPQTKILTDPRAGKLAQVTWVSPSRRDSDHPEARSPLGPAWVASVVNAVGESRYWKSTAVIILWDDWGGWYDNVPPPQLDFRGLGIRVPCLIISPYAKQGYVSHTRYEYGSILKFIEEAFNLPALGPASAGYTDTRANSIEDSFDFVQAPRAFKPIPIPSPYAQRIRSEAPSNEPVDTE
jgi:phospholipase C